METKHILYKNWMYYQMQTDQICKLIRNQEKIIRFVSLLDVNSEQAAYIYYKRDCLYFELHRRAFSNCIIQLFSFHKVNKWISDSEQRCACCKPEYYEFKSDCQKIGFGELPTSDLITTILSSRALAGGRCFFIQEEIPDFGKDLPDENAVAHATVSSAENPLQSCGFSMAAITINDPDDEFPQRKLSFAENPVFTATAKTANVDESPETVKEQSSVFNSNNLEERRLIAIPKVKIGGAPPSFAEVTSGPLKFIAINRNNGPFGKTFKGKKLAARQKRFRPSATSKGSDDEKQLCSYKALKEEDCTSHASSTEGKPPKSTWHFGFNLSKEDKSGSKK